MEPASKRPRLDQIDPSSPKPSIATVESISHEEAKQYDRQIRLWGLDAQRKMQSTRVLVINVTALTAEVLKNLVLAGVKSLTLFDARLVDATTASGNFFLRNGDVGRVDLACVDRVQLLNPREYKPFTDAIASVPWKDLPKRKTKKMDLLFCILAFFRYSHQHSTFPTAYSQDLYKYLQTYAQETAYNMERITEDYLEDMMGQFMGQFTPVCAIVGGVLSQEVLKSVSGKEEPMNNLMVFDGERCVDIIVSL